MEQIKNKEYEGERPLFATADLCFEYSSLQATISSPIHSVKNPRSGSITAESYGTIIIDEHCKAPGNCELKLWDETNCFNQ